MKELPFVDCIELSGSSVKYFDGTRFFMSTGALQGCEINEDALEEVTYLDRPSRANVCVSVGDIIFAKMQNTIKVLRIVEDTKDLIVSTGFFVVRPRENIDSEFIVQYLNSGKFNAQKDKNCTGATQKALTNVGLKKITVPELDYVHQQQIGMALLKIRTVINKRHEQLAVLDKLARDAFIDMFGNLLTNPLKWQIDDVESVCSVIVDCPHSTPKYLSENTGYYCIKTGDLRGHKINWDMAEFLSEDNYSERIRRYKPKYEDVVYSREGAIYGIAAMIDQNYDVALGQRMMLFSVNREKCDPYFFLYQMNNAFILSQADACVVGSASPHVNIGSIKKFQFALPPIERQREFAEQVKKINKQKSRLQASLAELEAIYKSTLQKAFNGELFQ